MSPLSNPNGNGRMVKLPPSDNEVEVNDDERAERTTGLSHPELYADDFVDGVSVERISSPPSGGNRLFTVGELTWAIVCSHVITLAICVALATVVCWRTGCYHGDDADSPKEPCAFDAATVSDFDLHRRQHLPDDSGAYATGGLQGSATGVQPASTLPFSSSKESACSASLYHGRVVGPDREEWVRRLLTDYRTQQQRQQYYRTTSSTKGVYPLQNPSVPYHYNGAGTLGAATGTNTTSVSVQRWLPRSLHDAASKSTSVHVQWFVERSRRSNNIIAMKLSLIFSAKSKPFCMFGACACDGGGRPR